MFSLSQSTLDFGQGKYGNDWMIINDGVMGGISDGQARLEEDSLVFFGSLSLENNGGFASVRSRFDRYDFSEFETLTIRFKAQGGKFSMMFEQSRYFYNPYFALNLQSSEDWQEITISLSDLEQIRMGNKTGKTLGDNPLKAIRIGFIKADKKTNPFKLEIDYIKFK
jgi:monofunctional biosynthetic peptidoglycan transglycosylase